MNIKNPIYCHPHLTPMKIRVDRLNVNLTLGTLDIAPGPPAPFAKSLVIHMFP